MARAKDRRYFPRVSLACTLRYLRIPKKVEEYRKAKVKDVSEGGFSFHTSELFQRRSCFLLDLVLPGGMNPHRSLATVAWIKAMPETDGYLVGGKFVEPNSDLGTALAPPLVPEK